MERSHTLVKSAMGWGWLFCSWGCVQALDWLGSECCEGGKEVISIEVAIHCGVNRTRLYYQHNVRGASCLMAMNICNLGEGTFVVEDYCDSRCVM